VFKVPDPILSRSAYSADVDVQIEKTTLREWLFNLPEAEYLPCCPPGHIAAGVTRTDDGSSCRSMSSRSVQALSSSIALPRSLNPPTSG
jgi:hypothetical protein